MRKITTVVFGIMFCWPALARDCSNEQVFAYPQEGQRSPVILDEALLTSKTNIRPGYDDWLAGTRQALLGSNFAGKPVVKLLIWRDCQNRAEVRLETAETASPAASPVALINQHATFPASQRSSSIRRIFSFVLRVGAMAVPTALAFATGGTALGGMMLPGALATIAPPASTQVPSAHWSAHGSPVSLPATASLPKSGFRLSGRNDRFWSGIGFSGSRPAGFSSMKQD